MKTLLGTFRLPFLLLTPACVFLGFSTAKISGASPSLPDVLLVLAGALSAHISVNTFNEYLDFHSGLDAQTQRTAFSGGSGALPGDPAAAKSVLLAALTSLGLSSLIGCYFLLQRGTAILPIGLAGLLIIVTYTQWLNRYPLLCLVAPGMGFGLLMVTGTHFVLAGEFSMVALFASLLPFFLVNNLLLLNQFPDIVPDARIGRRHVPIVYGMKVSVVLFGAFILAAIAVLAFAIQLKIFPSMAVIALVPLMAAAIALFGAYRFAWSASRKVESLLPFMALNVASAIFTPVFLGIALLWF